MDLYVYDLDEYTSNSRQGNEFAPSWPFRLAVAGSSDSGKTTMIINLLMGDKKAKADGERYVLCDAVLLVGRYLNEPKWAVVREFFEELDLPFTAVPSTSIPDIEEFDPDQATVVIFEDLMDAPKKTQEQITGYFTHGRHKNVSCIYVAQRFFAIPKAIRENVNYISLHGGHGSLTDTKRIISQYTEESESLAPVIDNLTLQREFIIFDLRKSRGDPLFIRVRWDTCLRAYLKEARLLLDQSQSNPSLNLVRSEFNPSSIPVQSQINPSSLSVPTKFSPYGQKAIAEAKKTGQLEEFARNYPSPKERKLLLAPGSTAKNSDAWVTYIFREAYGKDSKALGADYRDFLAKVKDKTTGNQEAKGTDYKDRKDCKEERALFTLYENLVKACPLNDKKVEEGIKILLQIFREGHMDRQALQIGITTLLKE